MIFDSPRPEAPVDQGDIIDGCPLHHVASFDVADLPKKKGDILLFAVVSSPL